MHWFRIFVLGLAGMFCVAAQAQWQWLDHSGRKVYSDQPPPTDIPLKNILKQLEEPITVRLYYSAKEFANIPQLLNYVKRVRDKLGAAGEIIETVRGLGYRIRQPED